jgi:hypothetical protein
MSQRTERSGRDESQTSPSKLTMAQAALLNLRGADVNRVNPLGLCSTLPQVSPVLAQYPGASPTLGGAGFQVPPSFNISPTLQTTNLSPALQQQPPAHARLPQHPMVAPYAVQPTHVAPVMSAAPSVDANLAAILSELQSNATATGHETSAPALGRAVGSAGVRSKFNAFTPIEQQLLLQAQAQQQVLEAQTKALEMQRAVVLEAQARLAQQQVQPRATIEIVPTLVERAQHQEQRTSQRSRTATNNNTHNRLATMEYGPKTMPAPHTRSTTLPNAPRVLVAPTESPLMASPALSFSSASSSVGLSPMTPAFVPGGLGAEGQAENSPVHSTNVKTVGSGDGTIQVVGLGVDMGDRGQQ